MTTSVYPGGRRVSANLPARPRVILVVTSSPESPRPRRRVRRALPPPRSGRGRSRRPVPPGHRRLGLRPPLAPRTRRPPRRTRRRPGQARPRPVRLLRRLRRRDSGRSARSPRGSSPTATRPPTYLAKLSWDPTTARFFDKLNVEKVVKPGAKVEVNGQDRTSTRPPSCRATSSPPTNSPRSSGTGSSSPSGSAGTRSARCTTTSTPATCRCSSRPTRSCTPGTAATTPCSRSWNCTYLTHALDALLAGMHDALPDANARYGGGVLKDSVLDADYFLAVARSLLKDGTVPTKFDQDERVQETLAAVASERIARVRPVRPRAEHGLQPVQAPRALRDDARAARGTSRR